jgi:hypothetical protein
MAIKKGWLLVLTGALLLVLAYFGYSRWRHHQLAQALHDPDPVVRMDAVRRAGQADQGDLLAEALHDDDPDIRYVAAWMLKGCSHNAETIRGLLEVSMDDHAYVRKEARQVLRYSPAGARKFIYKGAEDEDWRIRAGAAYALVYIHRLGDVDMGGIDPPPRPPDETEIVVSLMTRLLRDDNVEVRKAACFCLFSYPLIPHEALRVYSTLGESVEEKDQDARDLANRLKRAAEQQSR